MKLENQVCTLEQAKRINTLIGKANTAFAFVSENDKSYEIVLCSGYGWADFPCYSGYKFNYPAYTVAELGVMLPAGKYDTCGWSDGWRIYTEDGHDAIGDVTFSSEADARASVLIHLLENKHITAEEVNNRLQSA